MMRSFWSISLSAALTVSQASTPVNTVPTETLWNYVALDHTITPQETERLNDLSLAINELVKRAGTGDARAACIVGLELEYPSTQGAWPDYKLAAEWFAFSGQHGDLCGSSHYGLLEFQGKGVQKKYPGRLASVA